MTALPATERPRYAASTYEIAYLAAVERAMRHEATTQALAARAQRLEAIRGHRAWRAAEVQS